MGFKLFGMSLSTGYQGYLTRLNEDIHNALHRDSESTFDGLKAQTLGCLFTAYSLLPKLSTFMGDRIPNVVTFSGAYFLTGLFKKVFERVTCEEVQMIDKQTIGLIRGKCLVCKLTFVNLSFNTQVEYNNIIDMLRKGFTILLNSVEANPYSESSKYVLNCLKEILEKIKQTMQLEDFMEFDVVTKLVSTLMEMLQTQYSRAEHKEFRKVIIETIGQCYFEDENDNYLQTIKSLSSKLLSPSDSCKNESIENTILKIFSDISAIMRAVSSTKVAIAVIRIWYSLVNTVIPKFESF